MTPQLASARSATAAAVAALAKAGFDPDQERGKGGKWTSGGAAGRKAEGRRIDAVLDTTQGTTAYPKGVSKDSLADPFKALSEARAGLGLTEDYGKHGLDPLSYKGSVSAKDLHDTLTEAGYSKTSSGHYAHKTGGLVHVRWTGKDTVSLSPARRGSLVASNPDRFGDMMKQARAALRKAGFDPNQERGEDGKWTPGGAGGHGGHSYTGSTHNTFPYVPGKKEREMETEHSRLISEHRAMVNGGVSSRDPDLMDLEQEIQTAAAKLRAKKAERMAQLAILERKRVDSSPSTRPAAAEAAANEQKARERRRTEAERIQEATRQQAYEARSGTYYGLSDKDKDLLNEVNAKLGITSAAANGAAAAAQLAGGSHGTFRHALTNTTARIARSVHQVRNIVGNVHGIASTTDYVRIGSHLNYIRDDIAALQSELKALPADVRALRRQTSIKLRQAKEAADDLQQKIKAKLKRSKKSKA